MHDPGEDLLEPLVARLTAQVSGMRARSICALLWSLAVLRRLSPTLFATSVFHLHLRPLPCFEHLVCRSPTFATFPPRREEGEREGRGGREFARTVIRW